MQDVKVDRYKYIGGSDIPIIMGISQFKTRFDLLLEKAQLKEDDFEGNEFTEYGNTMEDKIRQYVNVFLNSDFKEGKHIIGDIRCHTDGEDETRILEIKTTSKKYNDVKEYKVYLVQLLFYMMNTQKEDGILAIYERPNDFNEVFDIARLQLFAININDYKELCDEINDAVNQFRIDLKKVKENPFISEEELINNDVVLLAKKVIELETRLQDFDKLQKEYETFRSKLKVAMQENGVEKWIMNNGTKVTLVKDTEDKTIKKFNETLFKKENEELYSKYLEDKIQKGRSGYVKITYGEEK